MSSKSIASVKGINRDAKRDDKIFNRDLGTPGKEDQVRDRCKIQRCVRQNAASVKGMEEYDKRDYLIFLVNETNEGLNI